MSEFWLWLYILNICTSVGTPVNTKCLNALHLCDGEFVFLLESFHGSSCESVSEMSEIDIKHAEFYIDVHILTYL